MQGGTIRGSLNLPAQSLFLTLPTIYNVLAATQVQDVVFYCGKRHDPYNRPNRRAKSDRRIVSRPRSAHCGLVCRLSGRQTGAFAKVLGVGGWNQGMGEGRARIHGVDGWLRADSMGEYRGALG